MLPKPLTRRRQAAVAAARAALGTPFRPQGRVAGLGLDCVGLVLLAARAARVRLPALPGYALGGDHGEVAAVLAALGCRPRRRWQPGDVLLVAPSARQRHLLLVSGAGPVMVIHAHAGLGRVVEGPLPAEWAVLGGFALPGLK